MCSLCLIYGKDPIEDVSLLKEAVAAAAKQLEYKPNMANHTMDFIDAVLDGREVDELDEPQEDPEAI
jgi:hypothetical protein